MAKKTDSLLDAFNSTLRDLSIADTSADDSTCDLCGVKCAQPEHPSARLVCENCRVQESSTTLLGASAPARVKSTIGARKGMCYNTPQDYSQTQHGNILKHLKALSAQDNSVPQAAILFAADTYNSIQRNHDDGIKFVRRGGIKNEVLARLLYYGCIKCGTPFKIQILNRFMKISSSTRGEQILRQLETEGKIQLPADAAPNRDYITRYFAVLGRETDEQGKDFVESLVDISYDNCICQQACLISRIVGAIWVYVCEAHLDVSAERLEAATDNTKKTTFKKFSDEVYRYIEFEPAFTAAGFTWRSL